MKILDTLMSSSFTFCLLVLSGCGDSDSSSTPIDQSTTYKITFTSLWNANEHISYPSNAHYSPIVAINHNSEYSLFSVGTAASKSFEVLAESGSPTNVEEDFDLAKTAGSANTYSKSAVLFPQKDGEVISFNIEVSNEFPLLSIATMIAPSPDWVLGSDSLEIFKDGKFLDNIEIDLYAINAGTESGDTGGNFSIDNEETSPAETISPLKEIEGFKTPFGKLDITKL